MAQYPSITTTYAGLNMIAESQTGKKLIFTKLKAGDGSLSDGESIQNLTALKSPKLDIPIQGFVNQGNGQIRLRFLVSNENVKSGFHMKEVGIYAKVEESGEEQLYAYVNGGNFVDWIPDKNIPMEAQIFDIFVIIGNASSVIVNIDKSIVYATALDLDEHNTSETAHEDIRTAIAEATKKAGLPVGFTYTVDYTELQAGQLALLGGKYLKATYTDLWAWVQTHPSLIKTETEWQAISTASGGRAVPFYSDIDDQYFRVPLMTTWGRGASSINEVGTVLEAGLPNITGTMSNSSLKGVVESVSGAFFVTSATNQGVTPSSSESGRNNVGFDASKSNSIYGKSTTVQPQSICRLWVVQAFGTLSNTGNLDMAQVAQGITDLTTRVSTMEAKRHVVETYQNGTEWYTLYSDRWCEQGGYLAYTDTTPTTTQILNLLKTYKDTDYFFMRNSVAYKSTNTSLAYCNTGYQSKTTASVTMYTDSTAICDGCTWTAKGYVGV